MLYFDYAASTPIGTTALKVLGDSLKGDFANPSSSHKLGRNLDKNLNDIRQDFLGLLDVPKNSPNQKFIFTSSATESNNIIIKGLSINKGEEVLYSSADHPSIVSPVKFLQKRGVIIKEFHLGAKGEILIDEILDAISKRNSKLIVLTVVNNQSGNLHNITLISKKIRKISESIHIHVDASQSFMKYNFSIKDADIDSLSISAHKVLGPKGIGGLYIKNINIIKPLFHGGGQEFSLRPGTINFPLIKAFHSAVFKDALTEYSDVDVATLKNMFLRNGLKEIDTKIEFPFPLELTSSYILTFIVPNISSDILLRHLEEKNIFLSSTSACSSRVKGLNPVFKALNINEKKHKNILRLSFSGKHTQEDMEYFLNEFKVIYDDIKQFFR